MHYYYDILLNWSEGDAYSFYEWNDTDCLELIKKIPFIKVKHRSFIDIAENKIKINSELLQNIKDKTLVSSNKRIDKIPYSLLVTDGKSAKALEFNSDGLSISRSNILLDDEMNILEAAFTLKEEIITYEVIEPIINRKSLRQVEEVRRVIKLELDNLYQKKELSKLRYLYYEYKGITCCDITEIYKILKEDLNNNFTAQFLKIYDIIKLSYHNV